MGNIRNEKIRIKVELQKDTVQGIDEQQLRWYGRVTRLQDDKLVKQIVKWNQIGTTKSSKPNTTWKDGGRINVEKEIYRNEEWLDRDMWKRKVSGL
jgi:hypothetical protein